MPAFPCEAQGDRSVPPEHDYIQTGIYTGKFPGITIRDYFAGQCIGAAFGHASANVSTGTSMELLPEEWAAKIAYSVADAMLAARAAISLARKEAL